MVTVCPRLMLGAEVGETNCRPEEFPPDELVELPPHPAKRQRRMHKTVRRKFVIATVSFPSQRFRALPGSTGWIEFLGNGSLYFGDVSFTESVDETERCSATALVSPGSGFALC